MGSLFHEYMSLLSHHVKKELNIQQLFFEAQYLVTLHHKKNPASGKCKATLIQNPPHPRCRVFFACQTTVGLNLNSTCLSIFCPKEIEKRVRSDYLNSTSRDSLEPNPL